MPSSPNKQRLRWQCRRGLKEVEVLLVPFLEQHFDALDVAEQLLFAELLTHHDMALFDWFLKRSEPEDANLGKIIDVIQQRLALSS